MNLTGDVTITPPAGFEISLLTGTAFVATNPIILTPTLGTLASTTINVRFVPTLVQAYTGNITHTSPTAATQNVAVSGTGIAPVSVSSIAALRAGLLDGTVYRLSSEALVTFQRPDNSRNQLYIQDATGGIVIDDLPLKITTDYNIGDGVTGITGTLLNYNNLLELLPVTDPGAPTTTGNAVVPQAKTTATITTADQAELVSLSKVTFTQTGSFVGSFNYTITDASGSMILRTIFTEADYMLTPIPTTPVNLVGLVGQFAADMQFTPRFSDDFTLYTPSWTSGYPKAENASPAGFTAKVNLSDPGIAYYVVLPNGASAPSAVQVKNGQDASGTPVAANLAGTITCALASTEYQDAIAGLTSATTYNVYFVAESFTNLQASPVMVPVTTSTGTTAPVLLLPTVSAITNTSAILGGEISTDGGSAITERGTVWSTTSPVTIANNKLAEGGTSVGVFSHLRSALPAATQIFYAAYATNVNGTTLSTQGNFYTFAVEPSEHVTAFIAGTTTTTSIPLTWADATTGVPPTAYLIKASSVDFASIVDPVDGTPETDALLVKNVAQGVQTVDFTGLNLGTTYYFKIYPYTGASATINYKTAVTVPTASAATLGSSEYIWAGADNASWIEATNWTPNRTAPQASDKLLFNDGTTKTITAVANETVGQIILSNNTIINLKGAVAGTLTVGGTNDGTDLIVPAGCALNITGTLATTLFFSAGATASISGTMAFSGTTHKMNAASASAIVFNSGASLTQGLLCTSNIFTSSGTANVVRFMSGSIFYQLAGSNPYGLGAPNSKVEFQTGSLFKFQQTGSPSFSNRSCADFEVDHASANINVNAGTAPFTCDNLIVTQGTLGFSINLPLKIKGNVTVASGATFNYNPSVASYISMEGTSAQTISGAGTITLGANTDLIINNAAGVTFDYPLTINGTLSLTSGLVTLAGNHVTLAATASVLGTPSATNMVVATGAGELRKVFTGVGSFTFPVGDNTGTAEYSPVTLNFTAGTFASAYAGVNLVNASYPGVSGSYLTRYWNVVSAGITDYSCNATFNYTENDVVGTESSIYCYRVAPTSNLYDVADATNNLLTATLTDIAGTFTGQEQPPSTKILNAKFFLEGLYNTGTGFMNEAQGSSGPQFGAGIADQVTIELHESASPNTVAYTFTDANLNTDGTVSINTIPGAISGDYYVVINHRNSIQTWSASAVSFSGSGPIAFDFTTSASQAYGNNMRLMGTVYALYGGDASQDGIVDGTDMALIDNASTSILQGYNSEDVNGDGIVDGTDMALIDNNSTAIIQIQRP
ncbi:MAG: dockerin type I repeat-containing protein [Bacteroidales bacterium]|nr:dockerin type I repeat-containing protein [Bacteroidales bacterium]